MPWKKNVLLSLLVWGRAPDVEDTLDSHAEDNGIGICRQRFGEV
jgi:hypothetical protein